MAYKPAFQVSAHIASFAILMSPPLIYTAYAYRQGLGSDNPTADMLREK